jgi:hypothetical protein
LVQPVPADDLVAQAGVMCGVHAQITSAAEVSLALRVEGATRETVRHALWTDHSLIKTYGPRGTVHLLPAADLPMWTGALGTLARLRRIAMREAHLSAEQTETLVAAIGQALSDAEMTIDELNAAVIERAGAWAGDRVMPAFQEMWPRWRWALDAAANAGVLCFGPTRGRNVTYTNPRRWLPSFRPAEAGPALAALLKCYLYAYGPATPPQFAQWLSAPPSWAARLFEDLARDLEPVRLEDTEAWVVAGDGDFPRPAPRGLRLLPHFDAYVVGGHPRDRLFPGVAAERALARGQAGNFPVLLVNGIVAGLWHQKASGRKLTVTVEPFDNLTPRQQRELEAQMQRLGAIQEATATLSVGRVTVGPHA